MKVKSTKRMLLTSILALALCFSMLVGTTFAWFTDSVTSANNIITSGNLDIELEYAVFNEDGTFKEWKDVKNASDILTNLLWEPGVTEVAYLRVANAGSLALKYQLGINIVSELEGVNVAGETFKLSDYIYFGVVEGVNGETDAYDTREEAVADVEDADIISSGYIKADHMVADQELYLALVVWMPTTVGNVANHNGRNVPQIDLGINVFATQMMAEYDSFGNDYDEGAEMANFVVTSEAELVAALAEAKNGDIIGIKGNVEWTTGAGGGSTPFVTNATYITLQGVSKDATLTAIGQGVGPIGIDNGTVIFKNLKIVDKSVSYAENSWEFGYLEFRGNTVFENCDVVNAIMMEGDSAKFVNCTFNSHADNEYAVWVSEGVATFENCIVTGARGLKVHEAYGSEVDTVIIKNNQFLGLTKKPGLAIGNVNPATTIVIQNNTFAGTQAGDQGLHSYETDTDVTTFDFVCADNLVAEYADSNAAIKEQLKNNATVVLPQGEFTLPSLSGKEGVIIVGAPDGSTVFGGENASTGFGSNFGKGTTIQNVTFSGASNGVRWSYAQGGTSTFENCTFAGDSTYGFHIDSSSGATFIFNNCTFVGFNAFAGDLEKIVFNNCTFLSNGNYGHTNIWSVAEFNNCTWGDKTSVSTKGKMYFNGVEESYHHEFIGSAESLFAFAKSVNEGGDAWANQKVLLVADIDLENALWTPIGQTGATQFKGTFDGQNYTIKNLNVDSSAQTGANYSSGFFGWLNKATVKNVNFDNATVVGNHNVAVVAGYLETAGCTISNCNVTNSKVTANHANDDACGDKVGVIVGHAGNTGVKVENCSAADCTVTAGRDAGQIAGAALTANVVDCEATNVTVSATGDCHKEANINNAVIGRVLG